MKKIADKYAQSILKNLKINGKLKILGQRTGGEDCYLPVFESPEEAKEFYAEISPLMLDRLDRSALSSAYDYQRDARIDVAQVVDYNKMGEVCAILQRSVVQNNTTICKYLCADSIVAEKLEQTLNQNIGPSCRYHAEVIKFAALTQENNLSPAELAKN